MAKEKDPKKVKTGKASKAKGARGERELASKLREYGYENSKRGQQYCGVKGNADVIDALPEIHIECKRTERLSLYEAIGQAKAEAKPWEHPAVFHRRNNCEWLVIMPLDNWIQIYREWEAGRFIDEKIGGSE